MFQMGGVGPMFGQTHHFLRAAPEALAVCDRALLEGGRGVSTQCSQRLADTPFLARSNSIADIATYPWVARHEWHKVDLADFPNVKRWFDTTGRRPAVVRGMAVPA